MASKLLNIRALANLQRTGGKRLFSDKAPKVAENIRRGFEKFQRDDGVPIYLKGGLGDRLLFGLTIALLAIGLVDSARTIIRLDVRK